MGADALLANCGRVPTVLLAKLSACVPNPRCGDRFRHFQSVT